MVGVYSRHGVSPLAALRLPLVQLPLFLSAIWALQRAGDVFPSMATGGPSAAFRDLTVADPSYLLPAITSASMLIAMEAAMLGMPAAPDEAGARTQRIMRTALRAMSVASLPLMANLPQVGRGAHFETRLFLCLFV
jgi:YidC/Oxa1 family membrane protein insertase